MMRIATLTYDKAKECNGPAMRDDQEISTYILSYQIAEQLLKHFAGEWSLVGKEIVLKLKDLEYAVIINGETGTVHYGSLMTRYYSRYNVSEGVSGLVKDICSDFALPLGKPNVEIDYLFRVFVKLIGIFHARCDIQILPKISSNNIREWELQLSKDGPCGWIDEDGLAENRFGQKIDIYQWENLRTEKVATYLFGFNRFCSNFQCPMK
ncbi:MAG: hypothetical protein WCR27_04815 [Eubacteriales bacterium]